MMPLIKLLRCVFLVLPVILILSPIKHVHGNTILQNSVLCEDNNCDIPAWCSNNDKKFLIGSVPFFTHKKDCTWAENKKFINCKIFEVKLNCPVLCDFCNCMDNQEDFEVADLGGKRSCEWTKQKSTEMRCSTYPEVKENCPLSCGECNFTFPTDAPTVAPLRPSAIVLSTSSIEMVATIPSDQNELTQFKNVLMKAFLSFLPESGTKVRSLDFVTGESSVTAVFDVRSIQLCPDERESCKEVVRSQRRAVDEATSAAASPGSTGLGAKAQEVAAIKGVVIVEITTTGESNTEHVNIIRMP